MEKNCVKDVFFCSLPILLLQMKKGDHKALSIFCELFNKKRPFYSKDYRPVSNSHHSTGTYWTPSANWSSLDVYNDLISKLQVDGGFKIFYKYLTKLNMETTLTPSITSTSYWSVEHMYHIVQMLIVGEKIVDKEILRDLLDLILDTCATRSSEFFKKESNEAIGLLLGSISLVMEMEIVPIESTYSKWLNITTIFIQSTSLPQRLFGLEQITALVQMAKNATPFPLRYMVQKAGTDIVNGLYTLCPKASNALCGSSATYLKKGNQGEMFTLFRCTMQSGSKWWFISDADKHQPGTDKDIDYYNQQSISQDPTPPLQNWACVNKGTLPVPILHPLPSEEEEVMNVLQVLLFDWLSTTNIIPQAFGDRIHREVVIRTSPLIAFLAESGFNTLSEYLDLMWNAAVIGTETTLVDEIHVLLVSILPKLHASHLQHLLQIVQDSEEGSYEAVLTFSEKLAREQSIDDLLRKHEASVTRSFLAFLWSLRRHPKSRNNHFPAIIEQAFGDALRSEFGEPQRKAFLIECIQTVQDTCALMNYDEISLESSSTALALLQFLMGTYVSAQGKVVEALNAEHQLVELLFQELRLYASERESVDKCSSYYQDGLRHRMELFRYVYGKSQELELSILQVTELWTILDTHIEDKEMCFAFLGDCGLRLEDDLGVAFGASVCSHVFTELICKHSSFHLLSKVGYKVTRILIYSI